MSYSTKTKICRALFDNNVHQVKSHADSYALINYYTHLISELQMVCSEALFTSQVLLKLIHTSFPVRNNVIRTSGVPKLMNNAYYESSDP
jgi:hypothetical protein